jgi:hypothetical protein
MALSFLKCSFTLTSSKRMPPSSCMQPRLGSAHSRIHCETSLKSPPRELERAYLVHYEHVTPSVNLHASALVHRPGKRQPSRTMTSTPLRYFPVVYAPPHVGHIGLCLTTRKHQSRMNRSSRHSSSVISLTARTSASVRDLTRRWSRLLGWAVRVSVFPFRMRVHACW